MFHFKTNPSSRRIAPTPAYTRTYFPLPLAGVRERRVTSHRNDELLDRILRYCRDTGTPQSSFGRIAAGDSRLISDIAAGRNLGQRLRFKVEAVLTGEVAHA